MEEITEIRKISRSYTYDEYKKLVFSYAQEGKTSGEQLEERIAATLINAQRIKRIDKQCTINDDLSASIKRFSGQQKWILIIESWCGDGAQCAPVIAKIAAQSPNIRLELIFRDENLELMEHFLTNGSRSIPKLICINELKDKIVCVWGPRPQSIQEKVIEFKNNFPEVTHDELVKNIHLWYAQDKTKSIQSEFVVLLNKLNSN